MKQSKTLSDQKAKDKLEQAWGDFQPSDDQRMDAPTLAVRAYIDSREQHPREAIRRYEELANANYRPVSVLNNRALQLHAKKAIRQGEKRSGPGGEVDPNCQAVFYNRAMLAWYKRLDDGKSFLPSQAIDDIERALQLGPVVPGLYRDVALLYATASGDDLRHIPVSLEAPITTAFQMWTREQRMERALSYLRQASATANLSIPSPKIIIFAMLSALIPLLRLCTAYNRNAPFRQCHCD